MVIPSMIVTRDELAALLAEWERRARDQRAHFMSRPEREQLTPEQFGADAADYLFTLRQEVLTGRAPTADERVLALSRADERPATRGDVITSLARVDLGAARRLAWEWKCTMPELGR